MTRTSSLSEQSGSRGLISSKQNFVDCSKPDICKTVDIHSEVPRHVETVVQLSKGNISGQNVRVEFSLEDMDMSRFQQGATYEQIQEWVQEKYGFHVTHLNIAKTKRKCGIISDYSLYYVSAYSCELR